MQKNINIYLFIQELQPSFMHTHSSVPFTDFPLSLLPLYDGGLTDVSPLGLFTLFIIGIGLHTLRGLSSL